MRDRFRDKVKVTFHTPIAPRERVQDKRLDKVNDKDRNTRRQRQDRKKGLKEGADKTRQDKTRQRD